MSTTEIILKAAIAIVLALLAYIGVQIPITKVGRNDQWILGPLNAFAAGVFISLAVIHLMPEAGKGLSEKYSVSNLIMVVGYFAVLLVEQYCREGYTELNVSHDLEMSTNSTNTTTTDGPSPTAGRRATNAAGYVLIAALSFHSAIEGLTIGIEDTVQSALLMGVSIAIHKGVAGLALGTNLVTTSHPRDEIQILALIFSASTPLGVVIGFFARTLLPQAAESIIKALSAGTFLYIGASELAPSEFGEQQPARERKLASFSFGVGIIYMLTTVLDF